MCGFAGVLNSKQEIKKEEIRSYARAVSFRGPDSCGIRILNNELKNSDSGNHALFFNRLAIVDLDSRSDQPFEDERFLLIFNGEIYNYQELRQGLQQRGIVFYTTSDTEVLFHLLNEKGIAALPELNGMFSFFWLDKTKREFIVARDRLGIKPLYYSVTGKTFSFGSELHSILRLTKRSHKISPSAVQMYLWMQFVPTPYTIVEGILKLPPGHYIKGDMEKVSEGLKPQAYWDAYSFLSSTQTKISQDLETLLKETLQRQLHADVPLGLFLSSGIDSSLLAALVNKYFAQDQDVNFFTVSFTEQTLSNESHDAEEFIKGFNNPHLKTHLLEIDPEFMESHIVNLYNYFDEPFGDPASLLNWAISAKARKYVTVALSGDGADELFWGYPRYNKWEAIGNFNRFPVISQLLNNFSELVPSFPVRNKLQRLFGNGPVERHFDLFLMPAFRSLLKQPITHFPLWATEGINSLINRKDLPAILDIKTYLADAMLYKVDKASMASSLEVRVPYLDNKILEYALNLPFDKKSTANYKNKAILKDLLVKLAPHYNVHQPKKGFSFPLKKWLRENWKDMVLQTVTAGTLSDLGLDPKPFLSVINDFYNKGGKQEVEVWYLFNLALWKQNFDKMTALL